MDGKKDIICTKLIWKKWNSLFKETIKFWKVINITLIIIYNYNNMGILIYYTLNYIQVQYILKVLSILNIIKNKHCGKI